MWQQSFLYANVQFYCKKDLAVRQDRRLRILAVLHVVHLRTSGAVFNAVASGLYLRPIFSEIVDSLFIFASMSAIFFHMKLAVRRTTSRHVNGR